MPEPGSGPCHEDALADAVARLLAAIPPRLRTVYAAANGRYNSEGHYWVVWPLERLVEDNLAAWNDARLPNALLAFGDDGTGNPFCVRLDTQSDEVVRWDWIDDAVETSEGSMDDFLQEWLDRK